MACQWHSDSMARDTDRQIQDRKSEMLDKEIEKFLRGSVGKQHRPDGHTWLSQGTGRRL